MIPTLSLGVPVANVSFGILALSPIGWGLMLTVVVLEAAMLRIFLPPAELPRNRLLVSLGLTGGWWLVIWVPWVTANEAGAQDWPALLLYMGGAFLASVFIESLIVRKSLQGVPRARIWTVVEVVVANLVSSAGLIGFFWWAGGVPGR